MKKILLSLLTIGVLGGAVYGVTNAFFSDRETSTGNILQAGEIDLTIDNTSYYGYNLVQGVMHMIASPSTTWTATNLSNQLFFNFTDLKPGDIGEDTISVHLTSNPAWVCADLDITRNGDNTCTDPELADDPTCIAASPGPEAVGELPENLNFVFWNDDGDNVLEIGETVLTSGPANAVLGGVTWALADSQTNAGQPMQPGTAFIGKAWCFGTLAQTPLAQDSLGTVGPDVRGPGVSCDGSLVNNASQSDVLTGNVSFTATQARNNPNFVCTRPQASPIPSPVPTATPN